MVDEDLKDDVTLHMANSAATCRGASYHFDMVRVGVSLLGYDHGLCDQLKPVMKWCSRLMHVQSYPSGRVVGYGSTFTLQRQSLLGVVPVGFADGYPLSLSSCGKVKVITSGGSHIVPVLGRVNMDQIVVDLTDVQAHDVAVGTMVHVIDDTRDSECSLPKLAEAGKTHVYEMLCRLSWHVPRRYVTTPMGSLQQQITASQR
jgi:alanine racemase